MMRRALTSHLHHEVKSKTTFSPIFQRISYSIRRLLHTFITKNPNPKSFSRQMFQSIDNSIGPPIHSRFFRVKNILLRPFILPTSSRTGFPNARCQRTRSFQIVGIFQPSLHRRRTSEAGNRRRLRQRYLFGIPRRRDGIVRVESQNGETTFLQSFLQRLFGLCRRRVEGGGGPPFLYGCIRWRQFLYQCCCRRFTRYEGNVDSEFFQSFSRCFSDGCHLPQFWSAGVDPCRCHDLRGLGRCYQDVIELRR
mmetsp:Transcript_8551/g.18613  ORF Transcript_8551/g.18613 Transcript_8551/m.18613 type:complete len:251 (+) Transcript_8551:192-944(+)